MVDGELSKLSKPFKEYLKYIGEGHESPNALAVISRMCQSVSELLYSFLA
jgi:hypothetical protein